MARLPDTAHFGVLNMRLDLSGFKPPLILFLLLHLLLLFILLFFFFFFPFHPLLPHSRAEALGELAREIFVGGGQREQVIRKQRTPGGAAERTKGVRRSGGERGADATGRETERGRFLKITHKHPCKHEPNILIIQPVPFHSCCRIHSCVKKNE